MNILILHRNAYYGQGLCNALINYKNDIKVEYCQFAPSCDITVFGVILSDAESLRFILRDTKGILYDDIKIILLTNDRDRESYIPHTTYDSDIKDNAPIEEIYKEIEITLSIHSVKMLRKRQRHDRLSAREYQIAICILEGHRNIDIARLLGINEKTVSTYKCRLFRKFKIKSILELREAMKNMDII